MLLLSILLLVIVLYLLECARQRRSVAPNEQCARCGHPVAADDLLCGHCHELARTRCPSCGRSRTASFRFCPWCGSEQGSEQGREHRHA